MNIFVKILDKIINLRKSKTNPLQEAIDRDIRNNAMKKKTRKRKNGNKNNKSK